MISQTETPAASLLPLPQAVSTVTPVGGSGPWSLYSLPRLAQTPGRSATAGVAGRGTADAAGTRSVIAATPRATSSAFAAGGSARGPGQQGASGNPLWPVVAGLMMASVVLLVVAVLVQRKS